MIFIDMLAVMACIYILWKAKQVQEKNRRALRAVRETKYLRRRNR
jgi:hypothetical protein